MYQPWHMIKGMTVCYNPTQPGVHMTSLQHPGVLLMRQWMFSWGISSQTWIEASVNSWTVCGATCRLWMEREMMSQMCSIGFRSGERAGESIASTHSSCRNCWHTCDTTWGRALPCIRRNPGPPAPAYGLTMGLRISSRCLMAVRVPLASTWRAVWRSKEMPPHTITDPLPKPSCWRMLQAAERSPRHLQTLSHLSHVLSVNLLSSVKSTGRQLRICQSWCSLANANHPARCWAASTSPTCGCQPLIPSSWSLFLTVWAETCLLVACFFGFHLPAHSPLSLKHIFWNPANPSFGPPSWISEPLTKVGNNTLLYSLFVLLQI